MFQRDIKAPMENLHVNQNKSRLLIINFGYNNNNKAPIIFAEYYFQYASYVA